MPKKNEPHSPPQARPRGPLWRWLAAAAALALVVVAPLSTIQLVYLKNGKPVLSRFAVHEDPWDQPRLRLLRRRENLDDVVAGGRREFDKIVLLRRWAQSQWKANATMFYYPPWDAVEILDLARRRGNRAFCAQYATLFLQACRSMGLHARYVDMEHFVVSVWSDDYDRWVLMDPTNDLHYERHGKPMGDAWLERAALLGETAGIEAVNSGGARRALTSDELAAFRRITVCKLADQLTRPVEVKVNGVMRHLVLEPDYRRYPLIGRDRLGYVNFCLAWDGGPAAGEAASGLSSSDLEDFRDPFDQAIIVRGISDPVQGLLRLKLLNEGTSDLQDYVVETGRDRARDSTNDIVWKLRPGLNVLKARVKTKAGWLGPVSSIEVFYKPSWVPRLSYRLWSIV